MNNQKSFSEHEVGTLYVVPTPIGNLADITYRAVDTLKHVAFIAAEDTRNTKKLLNHFAISTPLISYHDHNKLQREDSMIERLAKGDSIAIVSDAGMPGISDPGYELIQRTIQEDMPVVVLPGANAALCSLIGSGLPTGEFHFYGFLPRKKKEKEEELDRLNPIRATLLFYESPYRIKDTLQAIRQVLGNRQVVIARELTKRFEEYTRGTVEEVLSWISDKEIKGECCIVVEGQTEEVLPETSLWWSHLSILEHVNHYIEKDNIKSKEAIKKVAADRKLPKRDVYQIYHVDSS
ncbi:16S rRNA (cytidine(1402)-2'-O)-methyltransferase [Oceanobacillus halotolerans]|uniref:16S rRNA (cytidine(1402)-2'-O)-methyltransferase n=1 Tax=Oceanobacillus halotolerans TaxID=2663380 RepID=UPI0013D3253D|nr:16S rRNA (cytidine(1402)-2'-O)-methyltransferase [Oceanobacillus halotolerans]